MTPPTPTSFLKKRLVRHGNSLALIIDRPVLDLLGVDEQTELTITSDGRSLNVTPTRVSDHKDRVRASMEKMHAKYAKALKRLAE